MIAAALMMAVLTEPAQPAAATPPPAAAMGADKVICRRFTPVGSLIPGPKECKTKRQWDRETFNLTGYNTLGSCSQANSGRCY